MDKRSRHNILKARISVNTMLASHNAECGSGVFMVRFFCGLCVVGPIRDSADVVYGPTGHRPVRRLIYQVRRSLRLLLEGEPCNPSLPSP